MVLGDLARRVRALDQRQEGRVGAVERDERLGDGVDQPVERQPGRFGISEDGGIAPADDARVPPAWGRRDPQPAAGR